jgi:hypothetical protein
MAGEAKTERFEVVSRQHFQRVARGIEHHDGAAL